MKPIYSSLRLQGYTNSGFIDDSILLGDTFVECEQNVQQTQAVLTSVGFVIHEEKSVWIPTQNLTFLGNNIDSQQMIVTLPKDKVLILEQECKQLYSKTTDTIKSVAGVLGPMVSSFSAVEFGRLFYRVIEREKIAALKISKGNFSLKMQISDPMKTELKWWIDNLHLQKRVIDYGNPNMVITTDASSLGWAGICNDEEIGGRWTVEESEKHINCLELLAISMAIKAFCKEVNQSHVRIYSDNSCAISYINNMAGCRSKECNALAHDLWVWCMGRKIWLSACHVLGKQNISDPGSRHFNDNIEWQLNKQIFDKICHIWGVPDVDMFASRTNKQLPTYISWKPDSEAVFIDAFSYDWRSEFMYIFCPFSLIGRTLVKLRKDEGECIMILPLWPTQNWWNSFLELLIDYPLAIPVTQTTLFLMTTKREHPLSGKLKLVASRLSGKLYKTEKFHKELPMLSSHHGNPQHKNNTQFMSKNGFFSVVKDKLIQFKLL